MAENDINDAGPNDPDPAEQLRPAQECKVLETWQQMIQGVLGILLLAGALTMVFYYARSALKERLPTTFRRKFMN